MGSDLDLEFVNMPDAEVLDKLENSSEIHDLEKSRGWALLNEACRRAAGQAKQALVEADPDDKTMVVKYQQVARLYGNVLQSLINSFKQEGAMAFEEAKSRGLVDRFKTAFGSIKEKL